MSAILDHIDGILVFPLAGRARDDVRPGMRTSTFKKKTLVAYEVDESSEELVLNILGVFHGGRDWKAALGDDEDESQAGNRPVRAWQEDKRRSSAANGHPRVSAGQPHKANDDREQPLSVPRFPWHY